MSYSRLNDVGPWGTVGMAGNVKEWVWNEIKGERYILGGAWNEPVYMATEDDIRPPMDRAAVNGFRCVKETAPSAPAAYAASVGPRARDYTRKDRLPRQLSKSFAVSTHTIARLWMPESKAATTAESGAASAYRSLQRTAANACWQISSSRRTRPRPTK